MSNNSFLQLLMMSLGPQLPLLLVYLVAAILALIYIPRVPSVAVLTLVGCVIILFTHFAQPVVVWSIPRDLSPPARATWSSFAVFVINCFRALGAVLLVSAIFVGRSAAKDQRFTANPANAAGPR